MTKLYYKVLKTKHVIKEHSKSSELEVMVNV